MQQGLALDSSCYHLYCIVMRDGFTKPSIFLVIYFHGVQGYLVCILTTFAELLMANDDDTKDQQKWVDGPQLRLGTEWRLRHT